MDNYITIDELKLLTKFTKSELNKLIKALQVLISQNGAYDNVLKKDIIDNCSEIYTYLPQIKHMYISESIKPLNDILSSIVRFIQTHPNHPFNQPFVETITAINNHFTTFKISESLSYESPPLDRGDEESRPLHQRIVNPTYSNSNDYSNMIKRMAKTAKSTGELDENWKALALGIKGIQEGKADSNPYIEAVSTLMLEGVNRLEQREKEYAITKQKVTELSLSKEELKKRQREKLLNRVADGLFSNGGC